MLFRSFAHLFAGMRIEKFDALCRDFAEEYQHLLRPSSGEHSFYKVKDSKSIVMTDSLGNEPEGETAKLYVLTKK